MAELRNLDERTVEGFGYEWSRFDQREVPPTELREIFDAYFSLFPWTALPEAAVGADIGCGSGRWAALASPRVGTLHCVDASPDALAVARKMVADSATNRGENCRFHQASVGGLPFEEESLDFAYSLGVLHHVPDTHEAVAACVRVLKPGAPFLLYLYYALDNRPLPFRLIWRASDALRAVVSRLPYVARRAVSEAVARGVYWPLAKVSQAVERVGKDPDALGIPLAFYRNKGLLTMRTDAYDRLATPLERRFTRQEMATMMSSAGLERISFREAPPYWVAVGYRRP